jgi:hypothetical protein
MDSKMNERIIWDFVSKAREFAVSDTPDGGKCFDQDAFHNKFAELIVRECMEQVWYTREDGINGNVSQVIKDRIKEHFGVEE